MIREEAIRELESMKDSIEMAIYALKKQKSYVRLIQKYQERDKNQRQELNDMQRRYEKVKAELEERRKSDDVRKDMRDMRKAVHGR